MVTIGKGIIKGCEDFVCPLEKKQHARQLMRIQLWNSLTPILD